MPVNTLAVFLPVLFLRKIMQPPLCLQGTFAAYAPSGSLFHGSLAVKAAAFFIFLQKNRKENENSQTNIDPATSKQLQ
jgi:hypothetical protein